MDSCCDRSMHENQEAWESHVILCHGLEALKAVGKGKGPDGVAPAGGGFKPSGRVKPGDEGTAGDSIDDKPAGQHSTDMDDKMDTPAGDAKDASELTTEKAANKHKTADDATKDASEVMGNKEAKAKAAKKTPTSSKKKNPAQGAMLRQFLARRAAQPAPKSDKPKPARKTKEEEEAASAKRAAKALAREAKKAKKEADALAWRNGREARMEARKAEKEAFDRANAAATAELREKRWAAFWANAEEEEWLLKLQEEEEGRSVDEKERTGDEEGSEEGSEEEEEEDVGEPEESESLDMEKESDGEEDGGTSQAVWDESQDHSRP